MVVAIAPAIDTSRVKANFRTDDGTDHADDDTASEHGFHRVRP